MRFFLLLLVIPLCGLSQTLESPGIAIRLDPQTGGLASISNRLTSETWSVKGPPFTIETATATISPSGLPGQKSGKNEIAYEFQAPNLTITVRYQAPPDQNYVIKTIEIQNTSSAPVLLKRLASEQWEFRPAVQQVHVHRDPSEYRWLINLFLRGARGGLYAGVENAIYDHVTKGATPESTWIELAYHPNIYLEPNQKYTSDPSFIGAYRKEDIYLFKELGKLRSAVNQPKAIPSMLNFDQEILDWGEVWAMQDYIRSRQPARDGERPGFYVRVVAMVGGRKTADLNEAAGFHIPFGPEHVAGSKRFTDEVASLGHIPHIEWATEWFGLGGYAATTPNFVLENATGEEVPVNPHWLDVVRYGASKGIRTGIFETVSRNFAKPKSEWKVLLPDGSPWTWGKEKLQVNCWANRAYVQWRIDVTSRAVREHNLYMAAYDGIVPADWSWLGWPELRTECWSKDHGHPPGDIRYPIYRNILWYLDELQSRHPKLILRVASGLTTAYPWALKNLLEYHPNFYDGETGATYWTSYNFRFLPMYKSGVLLSATRKDQFEWLLLRSISVSDHFMLWPDAVGIALENRRFWTKWMDWADKNIDYLRVGRTLFREPWGDEMVASLPPALEGRLPAPDAQVHGSSHVIKDRGYVFLFNPSSRPRTAAVPINHWLGLTEGDHFNVTSLYPNEESWGPYRRGEELRIELPPQGAVVLNIAPAQSGAARGRKPRVSSKVPVDRAFLRWNEIPWSEINPVP